MKKIIILSALMALLYVNANVQSDAIKPQNTIAVAPTDSKATIATIGAYYYRTRPPQLEFAGDINGSVTISPKKRSLIRNNADKVLRQT
ncbi:hypothetical protein [Mucilaginibacter sp.]|uniref:hypothetical protein n=1 Tax=Mucilaginibacter sp. TaxID=1882438 RepID=UPI0025D9619E|nr:hypothetical protein [Mucilaginibacter sp.]